VNIKEGGPSSKGSDEDSNSNEGYEHRSNREGGGVSSSRDEKRGRRTVAQLERENALGSAEPESWRYLGEGHFGRRNSLIKSGQPHPCSISNGGGRRRRN